MSTKNEFINVGKKVTRSSEKKQSKLRHLKKNNMGFSHKLLARCRCPPLAWHGDALAARSARMHDDELGDMRDSSRAAAGKWNMKNKTNSAQVCVCVRASYKATAPALQRRDNMSAKCCVPRSRFRARGGETFIKTQNDITRRGAAAGLPNAPPTPPHPTRPAPNHPRLPPMLRSPNLQMTLRIPSTCDESLPARCDLFNPSRGKALRWQGTNHLRGGAVQAACCFSLATLACFSEVAEKKTKQTMEFQEWVESMEEPVARSDVFFILVSLMLWPWPVLE